MVFWNASSGAYSRKQLRQPEKPVMFCFSYSSQGLINVIFRLGIAKSRAGARQLVSHRHIIVNGDVVNIPSYILKPGDLVGVREKSKSLVIISESLDSHRAITGMAGWNGKARKWWDEDS